MKPTSTPGANILALDAFVRSVTVNAQVGHLLLLGAGASISSNVPSAATCIWQWKRSIFLSNHRGVERSFDELSLGSVQQRIQVWLDSQPRFPPPALRVIRHNCCLCSARPSSFAAAVRNTASRFITIESAKLSARCFPKQSANTFIDAWLRQS